MSDYKHVFLIKFKPSELIFDGDETKEILKFFFISDSAYIDEIDIDDRVRNLAQGLLVEAVDASFALGFVKVIYDTFYLKPPTPKLRKIFTKLGKKAAMHWFTHVRATDMTSIRIYESVRDNIANNFRTHFINITEGLVISKPVVAVIAYSNSCAQKFIWG